MNDCVDVAWDDFCDLCSSLVGRDRGAIEADHPLCEWDQLELCEVILAIEEAFCCAPFPDELLDVIETWGDLFGFTQVKAGTAEAPFTAPTG